MKKLIPIILAALVLPLFGCAETAQVFSLPGVAEKADRRRADQTKSS